MSATVVLATIAAVMTVGAGIVIWSIWYDNQENVPHWQEAFAEWLAEQRRR